MRRSNFPPILPTNPVQTCKRCAQAGETWIWHLVDNDPATWHILCAKCVKLQAAEFTAENAIIQAQAVVWFRQAELDGRCVRAYPEAPARLVGRNWIVDRCPYCLQRHSHGAGQPGTDPRTMLGHRVSHCHKGGYELVEQVTA